MLPNWSVYLKFPYSDWEEIVEIQTDNIHIAYEIDGLLIRRTQLDPVKEK